MTRATYTGHRAGSDKEYQGEFLFDTAGMEFSETAERERIARENVRAVGSIYSALGIVLLPLPVKVKGRKVAPVANPFKLGARAPKSAWPMASHTAIAVNEGDAKTIIAAYEGVEGGWSMTYHARDKMTFITDPVLNPAWPYIRDYLKDSAQGVTP